MNAKKTLFGFSGEVLFKLHSDELKVELENVLYDLVREKLPAWKQMRCLQVIAAIMAKTMLELGVLILTEPPEIHWPNAMVTKPNPSVKGKKGKKVQKNRHGIFGEIVSTLAPTLPTVKENSADTNAKSDTKKSSVKRFKTPVKANDCQVLAQAESVQQPVNDDASRDNVNVPSHQGLPVQGRRGSLLKLLIKYTFNFHTERNCFI